MSNKFKSVFSTLGLITDDQPPQSAPPRRETPTAPVTSPLATPLQSDLPPTIRAGVADKETVDKLKSLVLGASPIITRFMQNVELVRPQFPNDEAACMKAALAFTQVAKTDLVEELNRTVAAALLHAKKSTETDRLAARSASVGDLDKQCTSATEDIKAMEAKIVELQQSITEKRSTLDKLQQKIQSIEVDLQKQDAIISASFTQVETFIGALGKFLAAL